MTFTPEQNPRIQLNNGQQMPQLGLGVYKVGQDIGVELVKAAIEVGYRRFDTAALYDNEFEIGAGIRQSGLDREQVFVTTKIWNDRQGFDNATEAIDEALARLNIEYIDILLIHWPCPKQNLFVETWAAFERALEGGKIRGIGVSNFNPHHLDHLIANSNVVPALNQIELHPALAQNEVRQYNSEHGIATEAWSPLGRGRFSENATLQGVAAKHGKTVAQVIIRWHIELGNLVIPKTSNPDRLKENIDVFGFTLDHEDMAAIATLNTGERVGPNPDDLG
ncbi:MAG: aldo/keto reductase [Rhodoluna sp.]|nr:aldo/keto reductase [Rhodoluna sp.]